MAAARLVTKLRLAWGGHAACSGSPSHCCGLELTHVSSSPTSSHHLVPSGSLELPPPPPHPSSPRVTAATSSSLSSFTSSSPLPAQAFSPPPPSHSLEVTIVIQHLIPSVAVKSLALVRHVVASYPAGGVASPTRWSSASKVSPSCLRHESDLWLARTPPSPCLFSSAAPPSPAVAVVE